MKLFLSLVAFALWGGAAFWTMFANEPPLPLRIMIFLAAFAAFAIVVNLVGNFLYHRRLQRNESHALARGFEFHQEAGLKDLSVEAYLFEHHNIRLEQHARGKSGGMLVDIFDLAYETYSANTEGHSASYFVSQTVVALPVSNREFSRFLIMPLRGIEGRLIRLLGLTSGIQHSNDVPAGEGEMIAWFNRHYNFVQAAETNQQNIEQLLNTRLLEWLQRHHDLAFEVSQGKLLVWVSGRVVDSTARDELVSKALELLAKLEARSTAHYTEIVVIPPAVTLERGLLRNLAFAAFGSWVVAVTFGMLLFWIFVSAEWVERAPLATLIACMTATLLVWLVAGVVILRRLTNR